MLLAQINRDSQGMAEFQGGGGEAQHVTLCLAEAVAVAGELTANYQHSSAATGYFSAACRHVLSCK